MRVLYVTLLAVLVAGYAVGTQETGVPVGFNKQCAKQLWVTYRSFNKELERTGQFGAMGITNRCFFAANTINSYGEPYCEYPLIWKGFKRYDWSALDAQAGDLVKARLCSSIRAGRSFCILSQGEWVQQTSISYFFTSFSSSSGSTGPKPEIWMVSKPSL